MDELETDFGADRHSADHRGHGEQYEQEVSQPEQEDSDGHG